MVDLWGFSFMSAPDCMRDGPIGYAEYQSAFDEHIGDVVQAENWGFDGWAWAEHHFHPSSNSPSPHLLIASVGARTSTLRLTVMGSVLCLHDGRRHAEEVSMLDYLTHGRFEPGIAPGAGDKEAKQAGLDPAEIRPRYYGAAELLTKAIGARSVTHDDGFTRVSDLPIIPPLRPELADKIWATVLSEDSAKWSGAQGFKLVTGWLTASAAAQLAEAYRIGAAEAGKSIEPGRMGLRRRVFVAETDSEAQEKYEQSVDIMKTISQLEMADHKVMQRRMDPDDFAIGSPKTVADKLVAQCELGGYGAIMAFCDFAQFPREDLINSYRLIGTEVGPVLKKATVGVPAPIKA